MLQKFFILSLFILCTSLSAQTGKEDPSIFHPAEAPAVSGRYSQGMGDEVKVLYRNEMSGGLLAHTYAGFGLNLRRGRHVTGFRKRVNEAEFTYIRHPKEVKTVNPSFDNSKGFFYGKLNSLLVLRLGTGYQNVIYSKPEKSGVEIRYVAMGGFSLGIAKPVYLEVLHATGNQNEYTLTTERYDPGKQGINDIYGRAPFFTGFGQAKLYPGGYAKLGLNFEYGSYDDDVKAIECGVVVDAYPKVIPIMANTSNRQVYIALYINVLYGRKWF
ncbi:MAG TPA: hypothetical protein VGO45_10510 [Bacteroidia bacterium]|jgi:hypothetical protein|nr:hypothetical protein [Bacteroidia bacterium]